MNMRAQLLFLAERYSVATNRSWSRVSTVVFNDGKKLRLIAGGGDLTTRSWENAVAWFSANWPEDCEWPSAVPRPRIDVLEECSA